MAYDCRTYRVLIASPSDVEEERKIAVNVIQEWNDLHSYAQKVVLLPLRWETHTAPDYQTRPQEVINRAIVDDCDLLVGIFWTRIGSPTGEAESGTLEEIERVGKAGMPIMLYFSSVTIDPDRIESGQLNKLRDFKKNTYPKALVETYKTAIEFRDKFVRQLQMRVKDLQLSDHSLQLPVSFQFLSEGGLSGNEQTGYCDRKIVSSFNQVPADKLDLIKNAAEDVVQEQSAIPIILAINNSSSLGIRNLYVGLRLRPSSSKVSVRQTPFGRSRAFTFSAWATTTGLLFHDQDDGVSAASESAKQILAKFDPEKLEKTDEGWMLSFEWDALQPQRFRVIKPVLYVYSPEHCDLTIEAKVYADSFPQPVVLSAILRIQAIEKSLPDIIPNWEKLLEDTR